MLATRRAGVLCHITSLPGGTLGRRCALRFLDFIADAGLSVWQMLPLNPPDQYGSPYHSGSLFALHAALIDPALGLNGPEALRQYAALHSDAYDAFIPRLCVLVGRLLPFQRSDAVRVRFGLVAMADCTATA